ncbi:hypothetical protein [Lacticaseibacillus thailandensis]|uniref:hypothetical protein n=1 Tax=Lacticaseibacillus thailandensis TaxID=381741 RepID=UPI0012E3177D|nr:hypothetical protein [Lacticaseibacillus thailandensis]
MDFSEEARYTDNAENVMHTFGDNVMRVEHLAAHDGVALARAIRKVITATNTKAMARNHQSA